MSAYAPGEPAAVIHDIRYSRFTGDLRPRWSAVLALARSSALRTLGVRRSAAAKIWPFLLVAASFAPAVVAVGVPLLFGRVGLRDPLDVISYWTLMSLTGTTLLIAYTASTIPSLLTRERRDRVLTLWFSTAVSPAEYVVGKLLAALGVLLLVVLGPLLVEWVGGALTADAPGTWLAHNVDDLPRLLLASLLVVLFHAAVGLGIGSLTAKRVFAVGGYVALILVPAVLGGILAAISNNTDFLVLVLVQVPLVLAGQVVGGLTPEQSADLPGYGITWVVWALVTGVGLGVFALRYRSGDAS